MATGVADVDFVYVKGVDDDDAGQSISYGRGSQRMESF
jgi:hypothetical protein